MKAKSATRKPVRLSYEDGQVVVTPQDQDIFLISAEKATEACTEAIKDQERVTRFKSEFILPLAKWCNEHQDRISACFVAFPAATVLPVYVIGATEQYDFDLVPEQIQCADMLEKRGWSAHVSQIPKSVQEELASFFDLEYALQVHGS